MKNKLTILLVLLLTLSLSYSFTVTSRAQPTGRETKYFEIDSFDNWTSYTDGSFGDSYENASVFENSLRIGKRTFTLDGLEDIQIRNRSWEKIGVSRGFGNKGIARGPDNLWYSTNYDPDDINVYSSNFKNNVQTLSPDNLDLGGVDRDPYGIWVTPDNHKWVLGYDPTADNSIVNHYDGSWNYVETFYVSEELSNHGALPADSDPAGLARYENASGQINWLMGDIVSDFSSGRVYRFDENFNYLNTPLSPDPGSVNDVFVENYDKPTGGDIWVAGARGGIAHYDSSFNYIENISTGEDEGVWVEQSQSKSALWTQSWKEWYSWNQELIVDKITVGVENLSGGIQVKVQTSNDGENIENDTGWIDVTSTGSVVKDIDGIGEYARVKFKITRNSTTEPVIDNYQIETKVPADFSQTVLSENKGSNSIDIVGGVVNDDSNTTANIQYKKETATEWDNTSSISIQEGKYSANISNLDPNQMYEVRSYAENSTDNDTGDIITFTTDNQYQFSNWKLSGYHYTDNWVWMEDNIEVSFDIKNVGEEIRNDNFKVYVYPEGESRSLEQSETRTVGIDNTESLSFSPINESYRNTRGRYTVEIRAEGSGLSRTLKLDNFRQFWCNIKDYTDMKENMHDYDENGNFVLRDDIDAFSTHTEDNGWLPLGEETTDPYRGVFDGNGHTISNFYSANVDSRAALIEYTENGLVKNIIFDNAKVVNSGDDSNCYGAGVVAGVTEYPGVLIENIRVINSYIEVDIAQSTAKAGGIVSYQMGGTIRRCIVRNTEIYNHHSGQTYTGGIVGGMTGGVTEWEDRTRVHQCSFVDGTLDTNNGYTGGIAGTNYDETEISQCFSDNIEWITESDDGGLAGIVGMIQSDTGRSDIANCYARNVTVEGAYVGGMTGQLQDEGTVENCYFAGPMTWNTSYTQYTGGLVGVRQGDIKNCFWDNEVTDADVGVGTEDTGSGTGTAKNTSQMQDVSTFTDTTVTGLSTPWDFVDNPNDDTANENIWDREDGINDNYPYLRWAEDMGLYGAGPSGPAENSILNVKYEVPGYTNNIKSRVQGPSLDELSSFAPGIRKAFENLASGTYTVEAPNISGYSFDHWKGDIRSTKRTVDIHLSEKTITGVYQKHSSVPPPPSPSHDLSIEVETGIFPEDDFIPQETFNITDMVFVHVFVYDDGDLINADVSAEWQDRAFGAKEIQTGEYIVNFTIPDGTAPGRHVVEVTGDTAYGTVDGTDTFGIDTFLRPPRQEEFPSYFKYLAILLIPLLIYFMPENEWKNTPRNWSSGSMPGSWTYSDDSPVLIGAAIITVVILAVAFGIVPPTLFYAFLGISAAMVFLVEIYQPEAILAAIGFESKHEIRLLLAGVCFGPLFAYFSSLLGEFIVGEIWAYSILSYLMTTIEASAAKLSTAVLIPVLEACVFRGILTPTVSEKFGIYTAIASSGILFGLAHVFFGAGLFMMLIATIFGSVAGYITLRNQSLMFAIPAHITYNTFILLIALGII